MLQEARKSQCDARVPGLCDGSMTGTRRSAGHEASGAWYYTSHSPLRPRTVPGSPFLQARQPVPPHNPKSRELHRSARRGRVFSSTDSRKSNLRLVENPSPESADRWEFSSTADCVVTAQVLSATIHKTSRMVHLRSRFLAAHFAHTLQTVSQVDLGALLSSDSLCVER
jgi:hypothetical protein